jgi:hypothetical protein
MTENQYQRANEASTKLGEFVAEHAGDSKQKEELTDRKVSETPKRVFGNDIPFKYSQIKLLEDDSIPTSTSLNLVDPSASTSQAIQAASVLPVDADWLDERCMEYVLRVGGCPFSPQELSHQLFEFLGSARDTISLQNELVNLLGVDAFDFISLLIQKRVCVSPNFFFLFDNFWISSLLCAPLNYT